MTTYIKRVPQFKAVQYQLSDKSIAELFDLIPYVSTWKIDEDGLIITYTLIELGQSAKEERLHLLKGDWLIRDDQKELFTLSNKEFKAQYEAAPGVGADTCLKKIEMDNAGSDEFLLIPRCLLENNGRDVWFPANTPYLWNIEFKMVEPK